MTASGKRSAGAWATGGAVGAAVLSSACCWLPLLMIGLGTSAVGVAGFFEAYRPYLLGATVLLLAAGFYLVYFRTPRCESGSECSAPKPRVARFNKMMLWVATGVVFLFALFPSYVGILAGGVEGPPAATLSGETRVYRIEGMTCEGCAANLKVSLSRVPGIARTEVSYGERTARVFFEEKATPPTDGAIRKAIEEAGYRGQRIEN